MQIRMMNLEPLSLSEMEDLLSGSKKVTREAKDRVQVRDHRGGAEGAELLSVVRQARDLVSFTNNFSEHRDTAGRAQ